jgi:alcohol dehydrogenase (nicotinoprotein)
MCTIGTFSQYGVIHQNSAVKVDDDLPLDKGVLVGCGVPTGWGSAVYTAKVAPGDTVAVFGIGGIGINAVQGARYAGAKNVVAIDPPASCSKVRRAPASRPCCGRSRRPVTPSSCSSRAAPS